MSNIAPNDLLRLAAEWAKAKCEDHQFYTWQCAMCGSAGAANRHAAELRALIRETDLSSAGGGLEGQQ